MAIVPTYHLVLRKLTTHVGGCRVLLTVGSYLLTVDSFLSTLVLGNYLTYNWSVFA